LLQTASYAGRVPLKRDRSLIALSHDHHHGLVCVFEIRQALRSTADWQQQAARTREFFAHDLEPHFRAEREVLVPALRAHRVVDEAALARLLEEHDALARLVGDRLGSATALAAFADLLERHIRCEEREIFPAYQERVPAAARAAVEAGIRRILRRPDDITTTRALPPGRSGGG
jgi:hypothetical protein